MVPKPNLKNDFTRFFDAKTALACCDSHLIAAILGPEKNYQEALVLQLDGRFSNSVELVPKSYLKTYFAAQRRKDIFFDAKLLFDTKTSLN